MKRTLKELQVGDHATYVKKITEKDVGMFAEVSGDFNPVHLDESYASSTMFKKRIAHGGLVSSLFSTVLGTKLPGEGTIYMEQDSRFIRPVYLDDTITATVEVDEIDEVKGRVRLKTIATNQKGEPVVSGFALVMPPR
jgi:3-hydroxybutyryl-CoA dehydratase